jgi:hypothetical protein
MNKERLLKLADFLEKVHPSNFNWDNWYSRRLDSKGAPTKPRCGTMACALGWAALMPEFKAEGLKIKESGEDAAWLASLPERVRGQVELDGQVVYGRMKNPFRIASKFFGITDSRAQAIFGGARWGEPSDDPKYVACKIRKFVKEKCREQRAAAEAG